MKNRAGQDIKVALGKAAYFAYLPNPLPPDPTIDIDGEMLSLLSDAHAALARLDEITQWLPNIDLFIGAYVRKEALLSSQIEGTQTTLEDVLCSDNQKAVNADVGDVINYVNALNFAIAKMQTLPICSRLLCETHRILMQGVRGAEKNPGEFRNSQNWIGVAGSTILTARYIPPTVEDMHAAMSDLEKFINDFDMDVLLKVALVHYQFETIHPFFDGNGRIGRMLITLMLLSENKLSSPILYMSLFLKTNRVEYYDRLSEVRKNGNYEQWIKFFLQGMIETCNDSISSIKSINEILNADMLKTDNCNPSTKAVYKYIQDHPIVDISSTAKALHLSYNMTASAVNRLCAFGILRETTNRQRGRIFEYTTYLNILKSGT